MTKLLSVVETAQMLSMTPRALYQMVYRGRIPYVKMGPEKHSPIRFKEEEIEAFIAKSSVPAYDAKGAGRD